MNRPQASDRTLGLALLAAAALAACGGRDASPPEAQAGGDPAAPSTVVEWTLPATLPGSASPGLAVAPDGRLLLSWTNSQAGRRHILQFTTYSPTLERWTHGMSTIAIGHSMFVNWADMPHMAATPDGALWAHWLQKSGEGTYAYDVVLSRSRDGGANWSEPVRPHDDGTQTEHGFVSMWPQGGNTLGIAWLDGRNTGGAAHAGHDTQHGAQGAMTLRAAVFDGALQRAQEFEIDDRVCDCCQTAVTQTAQGALLVYRGRSDGEVRDILATRFNGIAWSAPRPVHVDGWEMPACPVNGPDVAATGDAAIVGWYTEAGGQPEVRLALSTDAGDSFAAPVAVDSGAEVLGRVAVALDAQQAWALWVREEGEAQSLWLSRRSPDLATEYERLEVAKLRGRGRATGFPQLAVVDGSAYIAWTDVANGVPNLKGVRLVRE
jgi:hypothetical protein